MPFNASYLLKQLGCIACFMVALLSSVSALSSESLDIEIIGANPKASADGSVPAWTGGLIKKALPDTGHHIDPYPEERPLFTITKENLERHKDRLSEGSKALLTKYPKTFEMDIYPSHRSASYPDWFFKNINEDSAKPALTKDGNGIINSIAGVNFPQPQNGLEAIWNHLTRWRGAHFSRIATEAAVYPNGKKKLIKAKQEATFELFREDRDRNNPRQILLYYTSSVLSPPNLAGGAFLAVEYMNQLENPRQTWAYDAGQRRVKRLPYVTYDNPALMAESLRTADDTDMFSGAPDRYNWELKGKKILYIPYNSYRLSSEDVSYDELLTPYHINTNFTRYEAHRVWIIEATLKPGKYHVYTRRVFYIDEDSWSVVSVDQYDQSQKLWRVSMAYLKNYYEAPVTFSALDIYHDLKSGNYSVMGMTNEEKSSGTLTMELPDPRYYSPQALKRRATR